MPITDAKLRNMGFVLMSTPEDTERWSLPGLDKFDPADPAPTVSRAHALEIHNRIKSEIAEAVGALEEEYEEKHEKALEEATDEAEKRMDVRFSADLVNALEAEQVRRAAWEEKRKLLLRLLGLTEYEWDIESSYLESHGIAAYRARQERSSG